MQYLIPALVLTLIAAWYILKRVRKKQKKLYSRTIHSQSGNHVMMKKFFSKDVGSNAFSSQIEKRRETSRIKVIIIEEKAYWVSENIFYVAEAVDGEPRLETATPINTESMSKDDMDKMLFILDSLRTEKDNDRGGAGNQ